MAQREPAVEAYLLGQVPFDRALGLAQRLVYETAGRQDGQVSLLICEHPPAITVGRQGSRDHIQLDPRELASHQLSVRWVNRGGGCLPHAPGQLAIYPIVPLAWHGWTVGEYLGRFQTGLTQALADQRFDGLTYPDRYGVWGRCGQVAAFGVAVKSWVTYFGAYLNVCPAMYLFRRIRTDAGRAGMSSLAQERQQPVKMSAMRESLVRRLTAAWGLNRYHLYTGHPLLATSRKPLSEAVARAS